MFPEGTNRLSRDRLGLTEAPCERGIPSLRETETPASHVKIMARTFSTGWTLCVTMQVEQRVRDTFPLTRWPRIYSLTAAVNQQRLALSGRQQKRALGWDLLCDARRLLLEAAYCAAAPS
jgi:hypothetical protein